MRCSACLLVTVPCLVAALLPVATTAAEFDEHTSHSTSFDNRIAPLLASRCLGCHRGAEPEGGLDLSSSESVRKGGESGMAIVPGKPGDSMLWQRIAANEMPPQEKLSPQEKDTLKRWIAAGAVWGTDPVDPLRFTTGKRAGYDWWALQPLRRPNVPDVASAESVRNPIDAFVFKRLEDAGLEPSREADRRTLIRRLSHDLLGLPPSPEEVELFANGSGAEAYDDLVSWLLASKHYGERWARHWLDVARFGESQGFERDKLRPNAWYYRDWVINALNDNMPYDKFARLQLAGDVLAPDNADAIIATGFLVAAPYDEVGMNQQSEAMKAVVRQDQLEDLVGTVGQTFLGLTVNCARCHDHKFDPIRQKEYYQLTAALAGVWHGERPIPLGDSAEPKLATRSPGAQTASDVLAPSTKKEETTVYAVVPREPQPAYLLTRGDTRTPGELVLPNGIASLNGLPADFSLPAESSDFDRRRKLAEWVTDRRNPLFARVIVNRVWHYHFGAGLVSTPNDFGFNGGQPSHPLLLDWLAMEFIESDYSLKALHRLIVTSATYRQQSLYRANAAGVDADNRLLWRFTPARKDAETLRDSILAVSGQLNRKFSGPPYQDFTTSVHNSQFYEMIDPVGAEFNRRTIYRTWIRSGRNGLLDVFDCPDPSTTAPRRAVTTTPLQSLALLNNSFVLRMADHLAERVTTEAGDDPRGQAVHMFELAYSRTPAADEQQPAAQLVRQHGLPALARVIFNSNEFLYVE